MSSSRLLLLAHKCLFLKTVFLFFVDLTNRFNVSKTVTTKIITTYTGTEDNIWQALRKKRYVILFLKERIKIRNSEGCLDKMKTGNFSYEQKLPINRKWSNNRFSLIHLLTAEINLVLSVCFFFN